MRYNGQLLTSILAELSALEFSPTTSDFHDKRRVCVHTMSIQRRITMVGGRVEHDFKPK